MDRGGAAPYDRPMPDPTEIYAWARLDERLTTSGQPTEVQLTELRDIGVRHVINLALHTHERALADEASSVKRLGMTYIHIPVDFAAPGEADFECFCTAMRAVGNEDVHVHCIVNARVSAFVYRYRRDVLGMDEPTARQAMEQVWRPDGVWATFCGI